MSFIIKKYSLSYIAFFSLAVATSGLAGELSVSTEVQTNIKTLADTKNCPQCDLSGAILNRLDLSGANLEGADLSRAKMYLSNLSGANLKNANLKEAEFGGADLADADLTGADLTGASLVGAYLVGAKLDGEMVSTKPYVSDDISEVEENVYVEDTVKPKSNPATEDITIGSRRDFEETPPAVIVEKQKPVVAKKEIVNEKAESTVPDVSVAAPTAKSSPAMQSVMIQEEPPLPAEIVIEKTEAVVVPVPIEEKTVEAEVVDEVVAQNEIVNNLVIEEIPVVVETEMPAGESDTPDESVEQATAEEQTVEPQITVEVVGDVKTTDEPEVSKETVEQEIVEEEPAAAVVSQVVAVQTAIVEAVTDTLPDNVLMNIERLLDTKNCYGCDLSGANLSGENLGSADLEGANLLNAILIGADLEDANLKGANLANADLSGADLSGADLYKADLSGANLTNTKLQKALLDDANMNGVKGYQPNLLMIEP